MGGLCYGLARIIKKHLIENLLIKMGRIFVHDYEEMGRNFILSSGILRVLCSSYIEIQIAIIIADFNPWNRNENGF